MSMAMSLFFFLLFFLPLYSFAGPISDSFLYPNSTFAPLDFPETKGAFLSSPNSTFVAALYKPTGQVSPYYLAIVHSATDSLVWSANPNSPVPTAPTLSLSEDNLSLLYPNGTLAWSTPPLPSHIRSLALLESGNLVLLDANNSTLWQSFDHPTNTLLPGQRLLVGSHLSSAVSESDLSDSGYRLLVTRNDAFLDWKGVEKYWSLASDAKSTKDYNADVAYLSLNSTGLFLFDASGRAVYRVVLPTTESFRAGSLDSAGRFKIGDNDFVAPAGDCDFPVPCGPLGLCTAGSNGSSCGCPQSFGAAAAGGCLPADGSTLPSPASCGSPVSYLSLGPTIEYPANKFSSPDTSGEDFERCRSLCSGNCSCTGFFYSGPSQSCYLLKYRPGSLVTTASSSDTIGHIKTSPSPSSATSRSASRNVVPILIPSIATLLLFVTLSFVGFKWWRRTEKTNTNTDTNTDTRGERGEDGFSDGDEFLIPGLPTPFTYTELALATSNFGTLIGCGGFGSVYKGELPDRTPIAVKRITNMGVQGRTEFCAEIAVIGKVHHVNLLKLRGYCAQGTDRMLVYDYMSRGSLDRSLFGPGPVLEWEERVEIAIGAARGLAYLHSGCDRRIVHCDIKPENILLGERGQVKIADFGMAKLMGPEQSGLFTTMRGTRGYLAPEWLTNSAITEKTDVYSYGMVLLEMIRGKKNRSGRSVSVESSGGEYFPVVAVERHVEGRWLELVDRRMEGRVPAEAEMERAVKVALCCLQEEPGLRPSMTVVAGMLEGTLVVPEPRMEGLRFLRLYGREFEPGFETIGDDGRYAASTDASTTATAMLLTYMSSQEVSGPR